MLSVKACDSYHQVCVHRTAPNCPGVTVHWSEDPRAWCYPSTYSWSFSIKLR